METRQETMEDTGHARYTHRLRVFATARAALEAEWGRCRWVWNESVAKSRQQHDGAPRATCGPAELDKMLTEARAAMGVDARGRFGTAAADHPGLRKVSCEGAEGHQGPAAGAPPGGRAEAEEEA